MSWEAFGTFTMVTVTLFGLNLGALRWMLERHQETVRRDSARWVEIEHSLFDLRAELPVEYVRREDWIRFSNTLDAKIDALREEMREEVSAIKERLYV